MGGSSVGQCREAGSTVRREEARHGIFKAGAEKLGEAGHYLKSKLRYSLSREGTMGTSQYKLYLTDPEDSRQLSFWHDIPVYAPSSGAPLVNMICEIPKYTQAKMEINLTEEGNPIMQDEEDGKPRNYPSVMYWNYGAIPQTWEDTTPTAEGELKGLGGDDDPLDIIEIGSKRLESGSVTAVKCVGALCMIDGKEIDWKIIAVRPDDPMAEEIDDADALLAKYPHVVSGIREWLRWYKTPKGKPCATFAFGEKLLDVRTALKVVEENNKSYKARFSSERLDDVILDDTPTTAGSASP